MPSTFCPINVSNDFDNWIFSLYFHLYHSPMPLISWINLLRVTLIHAGDRPHVYKSSTGIQSLDNLLSKSFMLAAKRISKKGANAKKSAFIQWSRLITWLQERLGWHRLSHDLFARESCHVICFSRIWISTFSSFLSSSHGDKRRLLPILRVHRNKEKHSTNSNTASTSRSLQWYCIQQNLCLQVAQVFFEFKGSEFLDLEWSETPRS